MRPAPTSKADWSLPRAQELVVEGGVKDVLDQPAHRAPAGAVAQIDAAMLEVRLAAYRLDAAHAALRDARSRKRP